MEIIRERKRCVDVSYTLCFDYPGRPGCGFAFPCDESGDLDMDKVTAQSWCNYHQCIGGTLDVGEPYVQKYVNRYVVPAMGICGCGTDVVLDDPMVNTCPHCGREYNWLGQELAPRRYWGEETGESLSDILGPG